MLVQHADYSPVFCSIAGGAVYFRQGPGNVGDELIRQSTIQLFRSFGIEWTESIDRSVDAVVYGGGGNMGSLYGNCISVRAELRSMAQRLGVPFIILPQSWTSSDPGTFDIAFTRERASLSIEPSAKLAPDLALAYSARRYPRATESIGVWLRTDREGVSRGRSLGDPAKAAKTVDEYLSLAARFRKVVTDRLHFAIAAMIVGRDAVLLPNSYHKNRSMHETWLRDLGCGWVDSESIGAWPELQQSQS